MLVLFVAKLLLMHYRVLSKCFLCLGFNNLLSFCLRWLSAFVLVGRCLCCQLGSFSSRGTSPSFNCQCSMSCRYTASIGRFHLIINKITMGTWNLADVWPSGDIQVQDVKSMLSQRSYFCRMQSKRGTVRCHCSLHEGWSHPWSLDVPPR